MKNISDTDLAQLKTILQKRFEKNIHRHPHQTWALVEEKINQNLEKWAVLQAMENTGGEPDVVDFSPHVAGIVFCDCSAESPAGRRSLCYDRAGLESRKEQRPANSAIDMAASMGIALLDETQYRHLQTFGALDTKTSSWLKTPEAIRQLGGALFGDYRYGQVFVYHNGAQSYYGARGFRGLLHIG